MSRSTAFLVRRLLQALLTLLLATLVFHAAVSLLPGDPIRALFGPRRPQPEVYAAIQAQYNFDDPWIVRYAKYMADVLRGDWGYSFPGKVIANVEIGPPVVDVIAAALPISAALFFGAFVFQAVVGLTAGLLAVLLRRPLSGGLVYLAALVIVSVPVIVLAYSLQALFGYQLQWLPGAGISQGWRSYLLPVLALAAASAAFLALVTRSELSEVLTERYIRAAQARAIPSRRVIGVHAFRVTLIPVIAFVAANFGQVLTALVVVEGVFGIPGIGGALFTAIQTRDPAMLTALLTLATALVLAANLLADLLAVIIDPRIRDTGLVPT